MQKIERVTYCTNCHAMVEGVHIGESCPECEAEMPVAVEARHLVEQVEESKNEDMDEE